MFISYYCYDIWLLFSYNIFQKMFIQKQILKCFCLFVIVCRFGNYCRNWRVGVTFDSPTKPQCYSVPISWNYFYIKLKHFCCLLSFLRFGIFCRTLGEGVTLIPPTRPQINKCYHIVIYFPFLLKCFYWQMKCSLICGIHCGTCEKGVTFDSPTRPRINKYYHNVIYFPFFRKV